MSEPLPAQERVFPSAEKSRAMTARSRWSDPSSLPSGISQIRSQASSPPDARYLPSGEKATALSPAACRNAGLPSRIADGRSGVRGGSWGYPSPTPARTARSPQCVRLIALKYVTRVPESTGGSVPCGVSPQRFDAGLLFQNVPKFQRPGELILCPHNSGEVRAFQQVRVPWRLAHQVVQRGVRHGGVIKAEAMADLVRELGLRDVRNAAPRDQHQLLEQDVIGLGGGQGGPDRPEGRNIRDPAEEILHIARDRVRRADAVVEQP